MKTTLRCIEVQDEEKENYACRVVSIRLNHYLFVLLTSMIGQITQIDIVQTYQSF